MGRLKKTLNKKATASSLTEVIVATSILLIVFAIALLTLNNMMVSTLQKDTQSLDTEIEKLIYMYRNDHLKVPLSNKENMRIINVQKLNQKDIEFIEFSIEDTRKNKTRSKKIIAITHEE